MLAHPLLIWFMLFVLSNKGEKVLKKIFVAVYILVILVISAMAKAEPQADFSRSIHGLEKLNLKP
jgi:hypothetical protein